MNHRRNMPPIPIPLRSTDFWAGRKWDEVSYMNTPPDSLDSHKCYSYPCFLCHKEHYIPPNSFVSKSYICMDKKSMIMSNSFEDSHIEANEADILNAEEEDIFEMKIDEKEEENSVTSKVNGEMHFNMVYESIDDLPDFVFEDIAMDLMARNEL